MTNIKTNNKKGGEKDECIHVWIVNDLTGKPYGNCILCKKEKPMKKNKQETICPNCGADNGETVLDYCFDCKKPFMKSNPNTIGSKKEEIMQAFKEKYYTQLIDDYGDEHLFDSVKAFLSSAIDEAVKDREEEIREKIEMIKFETAPEKRINFDDILSQLERKEE